MIERGCKSQHNCFFVGDSVGATFEEYAKQNQRLGSKKPVASSFEANPMMDQAYGQGEEAFQHSSCVSQI